MADVEEFETDSIVDQQVDIVVEDEESASDAEEIVNGPEWLDRYSPGAGTIQFSVPRG